MTHCATIVLLGVVGVLGCGPSMQPRPRSTPSVRTVTITTVPLLSKELQTVYPFLRQDFAPGGVLAGKEVYAFVPSTITVMAGDTLRLTLLNPEDDSHAFVLHDFFIPLPPLSRIDTTYVAREPGIFPFSCSVPQHLPMMRGELVVLSP
jgi:plastocyanin